MIVQDRVDNNHHQADKHANNERTAVYSSFFIRRGLFPAHNVLCLPVSQDARKGHPYISITARLRWHLRHSP